MTDGIDLIYDAAVASEKLKNGTKYERLTAIVFKILQDSAYVVHDMRLRGDGKETAHQIDVVISAGPQQERHRVLVECKDHGPETKVDLSEIRDFNGALVQLRPARGIFVTTSDYTAPARSYARDENIALVQLRPFTEQDWEGRIREIRIGASASFRGTPATVWSATGRVVSSPPGLSDISGGGTWLDSTPYYDESGQAQGTLAALLDEWKDEVAAAVPTEGATEISGSYTLQQPVWLPSGGVLAEFTGFTWTVPVGRMEASTRVNLGDRIADLILRSVQIPEDAQLSDAIPAQLTQTLDRIFTRDQITVWSVDDDGVITPAPSALDDPEADR